MNSAVLRSLMLVVPLLATLALLIRARPSARSTAGILLATLWNLPALFLVHAVVRATGWWEFQAEGGTLCGLPVDLALGWALWWGAVPLLAAPRLSLWQVTLALLLVDLATMPCCEPLIVLNEGWLLGELLAVLVCLLPAQLLGRWTLSRRHLSARAALQAVLFPGLFLGLLPAAVLEQTGHDLAAFGRLPGLVLQLALQLLAIPALIGLSAVQEFAQRGRGTPLPLDPPPRLVTSGPYAYVANPMQLSMVILFLGVGLLLTSWALCVGSCIALAFSEGFARWVEQQDHWQRFGRDGLRYRREVRRWRPSWRPAEVKLRQAPRDSAKLYIAASCSSCQSLRRWLKQRRPTGLVLVDAEGHPSRTLERLTYDPGDGSPEQSGVAALARALEHVHLGWALLGFALRLPGICFATQLFADALGFGPRPVERPVPTATPPRSTFRPSSPLRRAPPHRHTAPAGRGSGLAARDHSW